jgi:hypothetical protein
MYTFQTLKNKAIKIGKIMWPLRWEIYAITLQLCCIALAIFEWDPAGIFDWSFILFLTVAFTVSQYRLEEEKKTSLFFSELACSLMRTKHNILSTPTQKDFTTRYDAEQDLFIINKKK